MREITVRALASHDVEVVLSVQAACPQIAQWSSWDYDRAARGEMAAWVAEQDAMLCGFIIARRVASDAEILNFAVVPKARRQGVGSKLFDTVRTWARDFQAERLLLEVRPSNQDALSFYEHRGFHKAGRRPRYYASPVEDALLLTATIPSGNGATNVPL